MGVAMKIRGFEGEFFPNLAPTSSLSLALKDYVERRWPYGRRDAVAREWRLTDHEARSVCEGNASKATLATIFASDRGGWRVALPVMAAVIGQGLDEYMQEERARYEGLARRADALARDLRPFADLAARPPGRERPPRPGGRRSFGRGMGAGRDENPAGEPD